MLLSPALCFALLLSADPCAPPSAGDSSGRIAIRAKRIHDGTGTVLEDALLVIEQGKIVAVGQALEVADDVRRIEHDGEVSAGLIALRDYSGCGSENLDATRPLLPDARIGHAFDPDHSDFERLRAEGITTVVLGATDELLVPGQTAVVKTAGHTVLRDPAHLQLSLGGSALSFGRSPTSFGSAASQLSERLEEGQGVFGLAKAGELPVLIAAQEPHEILRALDLAARHQLRGAVVGAPLAGELAERIARTPLGVVLPAFETGMKGRELRALRSLAAAGVPFGFALDAPGRHPASLRMAAAAAVRAGVEPPTALAALTSTAASLAGVAERVGALRPGLDADFCLWSGPPTDLTSRLIAVWIDGRRAWTPPAVDPDGEDDTQGSHR